MPRSRKFRLDLDIWKASAFKKSQKVKSSPLSRSWQFLGVWSLFTFRPRSRQPLKNQETFTDQGSLFKGIGSELFEGQGQNQDRTFTFSRSRWQLFIFLERALFLKFFGNTFAQLRNLFNKDQPQPHTQLYIKLCNIK